MIIGLAFAGLLGGALSVSAACTNPSPLPQGYAAPCPVFSVSPASVSQSQTLTLSATPQPGTDYIYTTAYYAKGSTWLPVTLSSNNAAPSYSSGPANGSLTPGILSTLTPGTNYIVLWDWLWDATAQCYKGPGLNQCNTGTWRLQMFSLTQSTAKFVIGDRVQAVTPDNINVRATPSLTGTLLGTQPNGALGTVVGGPIAADGYIYWQINYDFGVDGWSGEDYLQKGGSVTPTSTPSPTPIAGGCTGGCKNYYVSASGSGTACTQSSPCSITQVNSTLVVGASGTCTAASGWLTIPNAAACIHVAAGNYSGTVTLNKSGTSSARIVFISDTKWGAKTSAGPWVVSGSYIDIDGFDTTNPSGYGFDIAGTGNRLQYNSIHDYNINACNYSTIHLTTGPPVDTIINGNSMYNLGGSATCGSAVPYNHGIYDEGVRSIITNNIISGATGYAIKSNLASLSECQPRVISNNILFNNGGGIDMTEENDAGFVCAFKSTIVSNNIIVNNGSSTSPSQEHFGINYYHYSGDPSNLVTNNMVYGNLPANYAIHDVACTGGSSSLCPAVNPKTDSGTGVTFTNFQSDFWFAHAPNYNPANYQLKAGSNAINQGTTSCASGGISPCTPTTDFSGKTRTAPIDIGAYEQ